MDQFNGAKGTFSLQADDLKKLQSYLLALLKKHKYSVENVSLGTNSLTISACRGNILAHYIADLVLSKLPLYELFGWAVRVETHFSLTSSDNPGHYSMSLVCEPASNEINPMDRYYEQQEPSGMLESVGESEKCRKAFEELAREITRSSYCP